MVPIGCLQTTVGTYMANTEHRTQNREIREKEREKRERREREKKRERVT